MTDLQPVRALARVAILCVFLGALVFVVAAAAKNIDGTQRNDVLIGTPNADVINGRGGNDRLSGLAGNDRLIGGPGNDRLIGGRGADRLTCGPGRDVALADARDTVARDCEVVRGLPPVPPPPPPPASTAHAGGYVAMTSQGEPGGPQRITFNVSPDLRTVGNVRIAFYMRCRPAMGWISGSITIAGPFEIENNRVTFDVRGDRPSGRSGSYEVLFDAAFTSTGTVNGSARVLAQFDDVSPSESCDSGTWPFTGS